MEEGQHTELHQHHEHAAKFDLRKALIEYAPILILYLIIALVVFWPLVLNAANTTVNGAGDLYQNLWNLWWVNYATFTLHTSAYFTPMLYYPVGASLVTQTLSPIAAYVSLPFQAVSLAFGYNIVLLLDFMLSGFFMYLLADYLVKNKYAAFIAGTVFAFAPMHMAQALSGHLNWTSIEFLPIFILFFLMMIRDKKLIYSLFAAIAFVFLLFMGDPEQGIITAVFAFIILLYYALAKNLRSEILNIKFAMSLGALVVLILVIGSPFLLPISSAFGNGVLSSASSQLNDISHNMLWSDPVASFLLPSPYNNIFTPLSGSYFSIYSIDATERVSYLGYIALALAAIAAWHDYKKNKLSHTAIWIIGGIIFGWLALGPYVQFGNLVSSGIPSLYLIYKAIPFFNIIREPARFDMILTLCMAVLAAYGFKALAEGVKAKRPEKLHIEKQYAAIVAFLIIIEYAGFPLTASFIGAHFLNVQIPLAYKQLGALQGNFTVLPIPAIQNASNIQPELYLGRAMYYQTAYHRPILTGYTSRVNETELLPVYTIPLAGAASNLEAGQGLTYASPVNENYSNVTAFWLYNDKVAFIAVDRSAYNLTQQQELFNYLVSVYGQPVYQNLSAPYPNNNVVIFSTANATQRVGSTMVAYAAGPWVQGYSLCASQFTCNATFGQAWWGLNVRAIDVYSPANATVSMNFVAQGYQSSMPVYLYLNSISGMVDNITVSTAPARYNLTLQLSKGVNQVFFATQNTTSATSPLSAYLNVGIRNVTFRAR